MKELYFGAAYYPELWDYKTIEKDIELMKEAKINTVRIGEFLWSRIEPNEGEIDVSFLVEMVDKLFENGIKSVMCTPTPTPPIWLSYGHPERLHMDQMGNRFIHGARQHMCTNQSYYREKAAIITESIAKALGSHKGVILWQLDNEFKCHISECFCEHCNTLWHKWLEEKYTTIENLNNCFGTQIWSEEYQSFEQVVQPFATAPWIHNSSIATMYRIFSREKIAEFATEQANIIRKYSKTPITTNSGLGFANDNRMLFENLDIASYDTYASAKQYHAFTINCDIFRNMKKDKPFWLMETSVSHTGALDRHFEAHPDGYLTAEVVSTYALGAEGFMFWLWRQQKSGVEQPHSAFISAWGKPSIGYDNACKAREAAEHIEDFLINTKICKAELAIHYSDRARAFMFTENHGKNDYRSLMSDLYKTVLETGIHRDLIQENTDLSPYKIVMTPFMYNISDETFELAKKFVENGGIWIVGPISGGRTKEHLIHTDAALSKKLEDLAGLETIFTFPMANTGSIGAAFGHKAELGLWSSVFKPTTAKTLGHVENSIVSGKAFITENTVGKGKVIMLGSMPMGLEGSKMIQEMIMHYSNETNTNVKLNVTAGTLAIPRYDEKHMYWVLVNMDGNGGSAEFSKDCYDCIELKNITKGEVEVSKYGYRVIREG